jgi:hypothetical protein
MLVAIRGFATPHPIARRLLERPFSQELKAGQGDQAALVAQVALLQAVSAQAKIPVALAVHQEERAKPVAAAARLVSMVSAAPALTARAATAVLATMDQVVQVALPPARAATVPNIIHRQASALAAAVVVAPS